MAWQAGDAGRELGRPEAVGPTGDGGPVVPLLDPDWIEGGRSMAVALHADTGEGWRRPSISGRLTPDPGAVAMKHGNDGVRC